MSSMLNNEYVLPQPNGVVRDNVYVAFHSASFDEMQKHLLKKPKITIHKTEETIRQAQSPAVIIQTLTAP